MHHHRPESLPDGYFPTRHGVHYPHHSYPHRYPSHHYRPRGRSPNSSMGRSSVLSDDDSTYDSHSRLRWILSLGLLLPALAAVIGVVAWAVSAEVVIGARRETALKASDAFRLSQIMNELPTANLAATARPSLNMGSVLSNAILDEPVVTNIRSSSDSGTKSASLPTVASSTPESITTRTTSAGSSTERVLQPVFRLPVVADEEDYEDEEEEEVKPVAKVSLPFPSTTKSTMTKGTTMASSTTTNRPSTTSTTTTTTSTTSTTTSTVAPSTRPQVPEKMVKVTPTPDLSNDAVTEPPIRVKEVTGRDVLAGLNPSLGVKKSTGDQVADVINMLVAQRRNSTGISPHIVVVAPLPKSGSSSSSSHSLSSPTRSAKVPIPSSVSATIASLTGSKSGLKGSQTRKSAKIQVTPTPRRSKVTPTRRWKSTRNPVVTISSTSAENGILSKDAETLMAAASLLAQRHKFISRNDEAEDTEDVEEGDSYHEPVTDSQSFVSKSPVNQNSRNGNDNRQTIIHLSTQDNVLPVKVPIHDTLSSASQNRMGSSMSPAASNQSPSHSAPTQQFQNQPQAGHQQQQHVQYVAQPSHQHQVQEFPPPQFQQQQGPPPGYYFPQQQNNGYGQQQQQLPPQFWQQIQQQVQQQMQQQPQQQQPQLDHTRGQQVQQLVAMNYPGPNPTLAHPAFHGNGQESQQQQMYFRPQMRPQPVDDSTLVSSSKLTMNPPGDQAEEENKAMISVSSGNPGSNYAAAESAPSKGLTFHFGGGPMGGGGQLVTSPVGIFKTLLLPLLPKPRVNLNGKVVFGVVLEKGVGFGKQKHPIVKLHPSHLYRRHHGRR